MAIYVYITAQCRTDAKTHAMSGELERFQEKLEKQQAIHGLDRYASPYLKKPFGRTRLIMEERSAGEDVVVCFLRLFFRGDQAYAAFIDKPPGALATVSPSQAEVETYLAGRRQTPVSPLPAPSPEEEAYLFGLGTSPQHQDGIVLETPEWTERVQQSHVQNYLVRLHELVLSVVSVEAANDPARTVLAYSNPEGTRVLYRYFPHLNRFLLIAPLVNATAHEEESLREKYSHLLASDHGLSEEELLRSSRRSYPAVIVLDEEIWLATQKSAEANLALSPEESRVLDSVLAAGDGTMGRSGESASAYPLFINGRPGSGKSTILQYLFAEHLHFHLLSGAPSGAEPLYLTYSEKLLEQAKRAVRNILRCDAKKALDEAPLFDDDPAADRCFAHFRKYLLGCLPEEVRTELENRPHIDYLQFRRRWNERRKAQGDQRVRQLTPELAWHAVRTFIKGMRQHSSDVFDLDSYTELPRRQRSVSDETFALIHEHVWDRWYRPLCEEEGFWDDQDLARRVLDEGLELSRHSAIFCDEAQDFTRIELELILRLSLYSQRTVPPYLLRRVPFAFAGDPFQTLNPTGFNWDAVQAGFHDNIVLQLDLAGQAKLRFNFQELAFNYRSNPGIVCLSNAIQLFRMSLFKIPGLRPQKTWGPGAFSMPVFFPDDNPVCRDGLISSPELVIIVPCQEGEELEYVERDPLLRELGLRNVFSPMRAKGLEFSRVVLYKFGEEACERYPGLLEGLNGKSAADLSPEQALPLEYFLNALYVAASRPQRRLFIIDTARGIGRFWRFATENALERLLAGHGNEHWSSDDVIKIIPGSEDDWTQDRDDPAKLGRDLMEQGIAQRDVYLLEAARRNLVAANSQARADRCAALIHEYKEEYRPAGQLYLRLGDVSEALRCLWRAGAHQEILHAAAMNDALRSSPEFSASQFLTGQRNASSSDALLQVLHGVAGNSPERWKSMIIDSSWGRVISEVIEARVAADGPGMEPGHPEWKEAYARVDLVLHSGMRVEPSAALAKLAYLAGSKQKAVELYARRSGMRPSATDPSLPEWLIDACAETEPYPENVPWLARAERWDQILEVFTPLSSGKQPEATVDTAIEACLRTNQPERALAIVRRSPSLGRFAVLMRATAPGDTDGPSVPKLLREVATGLVSYLVDSGQWRQAVRLAEKGEMDGIPASILRRLREDQGTCADVHLALVRALARSERLPQERERDLLKTVSAYLGRHLVPTANAPLRGVVSLSEAGAAVERANWVSDAVKLYEAAARGEWGEGAELRHLANERLAVVKRRLADLGNDPARRQRLLVEAREAADLAKVRDIASLPAYPEVHPLPVDNRRPTVAKAVSEAPRSQELKVPETAVEPPPEIQPEVKKLDNVPEPPEPSSPGIGGEGPIDLFDSLAFAFTMTLTLAGRSLECVLHKGGRLEIRDMATRAQVVVSAVKRSVRTVDEEDLQVTHVTDGRDGASFWNIRPWGLRLTFETGDKGGTAVKLSYGTPAAELLKVRIM